MKAKLFILAACAAFLAWGYSHAATVGDPNSFSAYGVKQVSSNDGGVSSIACVGIPKQNSVMIRNWVNDGGTSNTMYCGFDTSVNILTGMPVQANETLTVDLVALAIATPSNSDSLTDGGVINTAGAVKNKICCVMPNGNLFTDYHYMIVK